MKALRNNAIKHPCKSEKTVWRYFARTTYHAIDTHCVPEKSPCYQTLNVILFCHCVSTWLIAGFARIRHSLLSEECWAIANEILGLRWLKCRRSCLNRKVYLPRSPTAACMVCCSPTCTDVQVRAPCEDHYDRDRALAERMLQCTQSTYSCSRTLNVGKEFAKQEQSL